MGLVLVKNLEQIRANIKTVASNLKPPVEEMERNFYLGLVKNGICLVVDKVNGGTVFAPSRFVGYVENSRSLHSKHRIDGRETNPAIEQVLKLKWKEQNNLEKEYQSFCVGLGFIANPKGRFGKPRKYIDIRRGAR